MNEVPCGSTCSLKRSLRAEPFAPCFSEPFTIGAGRQAYVLGRRILPTARRVLLVKSREAIGWVCETDLHNAMAGSTP